MTTKIRGKYYREKILTYKNPYEKCTYPWDLSPLGYCWGYATAIDKKQAYDFIQKSCPNCDCWKKSEDKQ